MLEAIRNEFITKKRNFICFLLHLAHYGSLILKSKHTLFSEVSPLQKGNANHSYQGFSQRKKHCIPEGYYVPFLRHYQLCRALKN